MKFLLLLVLFNGNVLLLAQGNYSRDSLLNLMGRSEYDKGLTYLAAFKDTLLANEDSMKVEWLMDYALIASAMQETDTAFKSLLEGIRVAKASNSPHLTFKATIHLIELYRKTRLYESALELIRKFKARLEEYDEYLQCRFYHRAAAVYNEMNYTNKDESFLDTAIVYSKISLGISRDKDYKEAIATSLNELGNIYERMGKMEEALEVYNESILLWKGLNRINYANAIKNKGSYFLRQEKYDSSIRCFEKTLYLIREDRNYLMNSDTYWGLKKAYEALGDSLNFYKNSFLEKHNNSLDIEQRMNNKILDLTIAYEAQEKDALIEKSKLRIKQERQQARIVLYLVLLLAAILGGVLYTYFLTRKKNKVLKKLLKENEFLLGESNHRIKNNLQLIISIIGRQIYKSKDPKPELIEISDKINSIATLHQHLYLSDTKEKIAIGDYLNNIVENFDRSKYFGKIRLNHEITEFDLQIEKSVYLGLLVTELLTNSIKHAFPTDTMGIKQITFSVRREKEIIELDYRDNGVGLAAQEEPSLINVLIKQLKAEVKRDEGKGYHIHLKFKA